MLTTKDDKPQGSGYVALALWLGARHMKQYDEDTWVWCYTCDPTIHVDVKGEAILTLAPTGIVTIFTGGVELRRARNRINRFLPEGWQVLQKAGRWYVLTPTGLYEFYEGMGFTADGRVIE